MGWDSVSFGFGLDGNKPAECHWCHWKGQIKDTKEREVNTPQSAWDALAGREGFEYYCPNCGMPVDHLYTRMS